MKKSIMQQFIKGDTIMKKMWVFFLALALGAGFSLGFSLTAMAGNCGYVVNGDFEVTDPGSLGFITGYTYLLYPSQVDVNSSKWLWEAGEMTIVDDPSKVHNWPSFNHNGNMLVMNGSKSAATNIWKQTFSLRPDTNYVFSFELANVAVWDEHTKTYQMAQINLYKTDSTGSSKILGPVSVPAEEVGIFHRFEVAINSGTTGTFDLFFTNDNISESANDFAMDNICIKDVGLMVDIKPGSCPNAYNLKKKGVMPAAIMGSYVLDVTQLDMDSVRLCLVDGENESCIAPIRTELEDAGIFCSECQDCNCIFYLPGCDENDVCQYDGLLDLAMKFNSTELASLLIAAEKEPGDLVPLVIKAEYTDSVALEPQVLQGQDCIIIVNK
jgi:hypothetical protein